MNFAIVNSIINEDNLSSILKHFEKGRLAFVNCEILYSRSRIKSNLLNSNSLIDNWEIINAK